MTTRKPASPPLVEPGPELAGARVETLWDFSLTRVPALYAGGLDTDSSLSLAIRLDQRETDVNNAFWGSRESSFIDKS